MAQTSIGLVFLYDLTDEDVHAFAQHPGATSFQRIRWLLERVASKSSSDATEKPSHLSPDEVAALTAIEIESLFEIYLGSPKNQWFEMQSGDGKAPMVRNGNESAVAYFDRLIRRYASVRHAGATAVARQTVAALPVAYEEPVSEQIARFAATLQASQGSIENTLKWAAGAFVLSLALLGGGAAWLAYQSYVRDRDNDRKTEAWQQQMKVIAENNSAMEKGFTELAAENARLRDRLQVLEARPTKAAPKANPEAASRKAPVNAAPAKTAPKKRP